jgi:coenzyme F420-reducing hydrogenase beta subunit
MSSVMLNATCSFFDVKNMEESRLPSKTGAVRFLAVSALVASVFASALIPAVICTGVIAATTAAIMLKNRQIEQLDKNEGDIVTTFKNKIDSYSPEGKNSLLTVCLSCLTKKIEEMPKEINTSKKIWHLKIPCKPIEKYLLEGIEKYAKVSGDELKQEKSGGKMTIELKGDQKKIEELSVVSTLSVIKHLYTQLGKPNKAQEIADFIKKIQPDTENSINQATE